MTSKKPSQKQFFQTYKENLMERNIGYLAKLIILIYDKLLVQASYMITYIFIFFHFLFFLEIKLTLLL